MRATHLFALIATIAFTVACDDEQPVDPVQPTPDRGVPVQRDARVDSGPVADMAPPPEGDISLEPRALTLLADAGGTSDPGVINVTNAGDAPVTITQIALADGPFALVDPPQLPAELAPGDTVPITITFSPAEEGEAMTTLTILSDDPDEGMLTLPISGRTRESCIRAMPSSVNLGSVALGGQSARFRVQVANCGDRPITIGDIALEGESGFNWEVEQGMGVGQVMRQGDVLVLAVWYDNSALEIDAAATSTLIVGTDLPRGPLEVNIRVTGGGGPSCDIQLSPDQHDYQILRVGLTRPFEFTVFNAGTAECELRSLMVEPTAGPPENGFVVTRGLEGDVLPGRTEATIEVAYAPTVANPLADRGELRLAYFDPHQVQNRRATSLLVGIGAEALIGPNPEEVNFGVTSAGCASWIRDGRAANVGFVPICVSDFRYEGDDCPRFIPVEEPDFSEGCIPLERDESVLFRWRHQPGGPGADRCTVIVESDAQNTGELSFDIVGEGTDTAETTDTWEVGRLNQRQRAFFTLSRPGVEDSIRMFVNDEETDAFGWDEERNAVFFERNRHPAEEGDALRVEYDALCYDLIRPE